MTLLALAAALAPYGVSVRTGRKLIAQGKLPAIKIDGWRVDPRDVAELLRPKLREPKPRPKREGENARAARQLAAAGIG